jgi:hypothetical protein
MYDVQDNRDDSLCPQRQELLANFWYVISKWNRTLGGIPRCRWESTPNLVGLDAGVLTALPGPGQCSVAARVRSCEPSDF